MTDKVIHLDRIDGKVRRVSGPSTGDFSPFRQVSDDLDRVIRDIALAPSCERHTGFVPDFPDDAA